jgi:hypothetical protein
MARLTLGYQGRVSLMVTGDQLQVTESFLVFVTVFFVIHDDDDDDPEH